jgi:hypothetical protein
MRSVLFIVNVDHYHVPAYAEWCIKDNFTIYTASYLIFTLKINVALQKRNVIKFYQRRVLQIQSLLI